MQNNLIFPEEFNKLLTSVRDYIETQIFLCKKSPQDSDPVLAANWENILHYLNEGISMLLVNKLVYGLTFSEELVRFREIWQRFYILYELPMKSGIINRMNEIKDLYLAACEIAPMIKKWSLTLLPKELNFDSEPTEKK